MARIGVVCEGSHDFCFLSEVVDQLLIDRGTFPNSFHALQPQVDASSRQLDGGGYEAVRQWLISNSGLPLRTFFLPSLFATSPVYDAVIIQMDGDVADICKDFRDSLYSQQIANVFDRVSAIRSWIAGMAKAEPAFSNKLVAAVPTLQMEAWVLAGIMRSTTVVEDRNRKLAAKRVLRRRFTGSAVDQVIAAGRRSRPYIAEMRSKAVSFDMFCNDLNIAV